MRQDRDSETKVCACCGQELAVRGKLSLNVDEAVLSLCNQAYDDAFRRGSAQVEIAHLAFCLANAAPSRLAAGRVDRHALRASADQWLAANAGRSETGARRAASGELKRLLAQAERNAAARGAEFATIDDVLAALLRCASELSTASFVARAAASGAGGERSYADRIYPDRGRHDRDVRHRDEPARRWPEVVENPIADAYPYAHDYEHEYEEDEDDCDEPQRAAALVTREHSADDRPRPPRAPRSGPGHSTRGGTWSARASSRMRDDGAARADQARDADPVYPQAFFERLDGLERAVLAIERELGRLVRANALANRATATSELGRETSDGRASDTRDSGSARSTGNSASGSGGTSRAASRRVSLGRFRRRRRVHSRSSRQRAWREQDRIKALPPRESERTTHPRLALAAAAVQHEPEDADLGDLEDDAMLDGPDASSGAREKRFYLALDDEVVRAPSIGPRTAERLGAAGIVLVRHLLSCDPERAARKLNNRFLSIARIKDFQAQASLVCTIPWLRGTHAQLLVGAGYRTLDDIVAADIEEVCAGVLRYAATREGQSVLRAGPPPSIERIAHWVRNAALAEPERAAA